MIHLVQGGCYGTLHQTMTQQALSNPQCIVIGGSMMLPPVQKVTTFAIKKMKVNVTTIWTKGKSNQYFNNQIQNLISATLKEEKNESEVRIW